MKGNFKNMLFVSLLSVSMFSIISTPFAEKVVQETDWSEFSIPNLVERYKDYSDEKQQELIEQNKLNNENKK